MSISDTVRQAIVSCGLTQYRLARQLHIAESTIGRFMAGAPIKTDLLDRLGKLLGISVRVHTPPETQELARVVRRRHTKGLKHGKHHDVGRA